MWRFRITSFVNNPANVTSKNFSFEHCVVVYINVNDLEKQSGFCTAAAAQYCAAGRGIVKNAFNLVI